MLPFHSRETDFPVNYLCFPEEHNRPLMVPAIAARRRGCNMYLFRNWDGCDMEKNGEIKDIQ